MDRSAARQGAGLRAADQTSGSLSRIGWPAFSGENFTAKHLADGADAKHRIAIRTLVPTVGDLSETGEGHLAVAHRDEQEAGDLCVEVRNRAREVDYLGE